MAGVTQTHSVMGQTLSPDEQSNDLLSIETALRVDPVTGAWSLTEWDIECIAVGAGILGTGGGFSPNICRLRARKVLQQGKQIKVFTPER